MDPHESDRSQLTDLREKLTTAFGEITALVKQKTQADSEMMQDVNTLQQNLSQKTYEPLELLWEGVLEELVAGISVS